MGYLPLAEFPIVLKADPLHADPGPFNVVDLVIVAGVTILGDETADATS